MPIVPIVLLAAAVIVIGAVEGKPAGWFVIGLGILALLSPFVFGGWHH